mgnify:CR=1 FL=1
MLEMVEDGVDNVAKLEAQLPPFQSRVGHIDWVPLLRAYAAFDCFRLILGTCYCLQSMVGRFRRIKRMGEDLLNGKKNAYDDACSDDEN